MLSEQDQFPLYYFTKYIPLTCRNENSRLIFFSVEKHSGRVVSLFEIVYLGMILSGLFINISNEYLAKLCSTCEHSLWPYPLLLTHLNIKARTLDNKSLVVILVDHRFWSSVRKCHWISNLGFFIISLCCFLAYDVGDIYNRWDIKLYYS